MTLKSNRYPQSGSLRSFTPNKCFTILFILFFLSLNVQNLFCNLYFRFLIWWQYDIQDDCKQCCRHDSGATEDQCDRLWKMCKDCGVCAKSISKTKCNGNDGYISRSYRPLGNQLDTADYDG